jgi:hypothetical protein
MCSQPNEQEHFMSARSITLLALGVALGFAASSRLAISATEREQLGALNANQGIYVDPKTFNIMKGEAKTDPSADLVKMQAQEVKAGAIIFRAGDKLYLVDTDPKGGKSYLYTGWAADAFHGGTP